SGSAEPDQAQRLTAAHADTSSVQFLLLRPGKYVVERFLALALIMPSEISLRIGRGRSLVVVPSSLLICSMRRPGFDLTKEANFDDSASRSAAVRLAPRTPRGPPTC